MDPADRAARLAVDAQLPPDTSFACQVPTTRAARTWLDATAGSSGARLTPVSSLGRRPCAPGVCGAPGRSSALVPGAS